MEDRIDPYAVGSSMKSMKDPAEESSKLFSSGQMVVTSLFGSGLTAGILMASMFKQTNKPKAWGRIAIGCGAVYSVVSAFFGPEVFMFACMPISALAGIWHDTFFRDIRTPELWSTWKFAMGTAFAVLLPSLVICLFFSPFFNLAEYLDSLWWLQDLF